MGYMRHHAIIVTSCNHDALEAAQRKAAELFMGSKDGITQWHVIAEVTSCTHADRNNSYSSFMIAPDGSKEGWDESHEGDEARLEFKHWLDLQRYEDGSGALDWVEVQYGDDNRNTAIAAHSDEAFRRDSANWEAVG